MIAAATIEDACILVTDGTHYTPKDAGEGVPFLTVKDLTDEALDFVGCSFISEADYHAARAGNSAPQRGDVLFSKDGTVGKVHVVDTDRQFAVLSSLAILRPKRGAVDPKYLGHVLRSPSVLDDAMKRKTGSAIRRVILSDLKNVRIPLPSLPEQRRIAAILDKADALRAMRRAAIAKLDTLTQFIFLDMFGDPGTNPMGWRRVPFAQLLEGIESGWSPTCLDRPATDDEWGVLKLGSVTWCEYDPSENKALPPHLEARPGLEIRSGDLLFARKNTYDLVGGSALVRSTPPRLLLPDLIFRFRFAAAAPVDPAFLHQLLINPAKRSEIQKLAGGSAGSMPNISKGRLERLPIELPPVDRQQDFARRIAAVHVSKAAYHASMRELNALFASLQHRAFRGEL